MKAGALVFTLVALLVTVDIRSDAKPIEATRHFYSGELHPIELTYATAAPNNMEDSKEDRHDMHKARDNAGSDVMPLEVIRHFPGELHPIELTNAAGAPDTMEDGDGYGIPHTARDVSWQNTDQWEK